MAVIYTLADPDTGAIRYVGKAINLKVRMRRHLHPVNLAKRHHAANWLRSLVAAGKRPAEAVIEEVAAGEDWESRERYWIAHYRTAGCDLTNAMPGGEGGATFGRLGKRNSEEHRRKCSLARTGKPIAQRDPAGKRAVGIKASWERRKAEAAARGETVRVKPRSEESRRRMSEIARAQNRNLDKARAAAIAVIKGKPAHNRGVPMPAEQRAKVSASKKGVPWSDARRVAQQRRV